MISLDFFILKYLSYHLNGVLITGKFHLLEILLLQILK